MHNRKRNTVKMVRYSREGEHGQKEQTVEREGTVEGEAESKKRKYGPKKKVTWLRRRRRSRGEKTRSNAGMRAVITVLYLMRRLDSLHSLEAK